MDSSSQGGPSAVRAGRRQSFDAKRFATGSPMVILAVTGVVVALDWASKLIAAITLDDGPIAVGSLITLRLGHNSGVSFGMGNSLPGALVVAVTGSIAAALAVAAFRGAFPSPTGAGLVVGGAVANVGDRILGGSVVDFLDLGWWPSFNVADIALAIGCVLLVVASWRTPTTASS